MMKEKNILEHTKECYSKYSVAANIRSLPSINDGMKPVQRRILSTFYSLHNKGEFLASPSVVGTTLKLYHPHGSSSIYGALVNMINDFSPIIKGKGNFGYNGKNFIESSEAASERYTKVSLNEDGIEYLRLFKHSKFFENENEELEPEFIPTHLPYCFLNGAEGIGVGCNTVIPCFKKSDLERVVKEILLEKDEIKQITPFVKNGVIEIKKSEVSLLNQKGICSVEIKANIEETESGFKISNIPDKINVNKLLIKEFNSNIEKKDISIKNESDDSVKIGIYISKNSKILKEEVLNKLKKIFRVKVSYKCILSDGDKSILTTPINVIKNCVEKALDSYKKSLDEDIKKLKDEIEFLSNKDLILDSLKKDELANIKKEWLGRSLSSLLNSKINVDTLILKKEALEKKLLNIKVSYYEDFLNKKK